MLPQKCMKLKSASYVTLSLASSAVAFAADSWRSTSVTLAWWRARLVISDSSCCCCICNEDERRRLVSRSNSASARARAASERAVADSSRE
jgi:hypothetical protein